MCIMKKVIEMNDPTTTSQQKKEKEKGKTEYHNNNNQKERPSFDATVPNKLKSSQHRHSPTRRCCSVSGGMGSLALQLVLLNLHEFDQHRGSLPNADLSPEH